MHKLKNYCEMCRRSFRDANGMKCHLGSEQHIQNMKMFAADPQKYIKRFTDTLLVEFAKLCRRHSGKRVSIHSIYQEYIQDRNHIHLSSTKFGNIGELAKHLSDTGKCTMEVDDGKVFITWLDDSPEEAARKAALAKLEARAQASQSEQERELEEVQAQAKRAKEGHAEVSSSAREEKTVKPLEKGKGKQISLSFKPKSFGVASSAAAKPKPNVFAKLKQDAKEKSLKETQEKSLKETQETCDRESRGKSEAPSRSGDNGPAAGGKLSTLDSIIENDILGKKRPRGYGSGTAPSQKRQHQ